MKTQRLITTYKFGAPTDKQWVRAIKIFHKVGQLTNYQESSRYVSMFFTTKVSRKGVFYKAHFYSGTAMRTLDIFTYIEDSDEWKRG